MESVEHYVGLLRDGIDSLDADSDEIKAVKALQRVIKANPLELDWTSITRQLPLHASVDVKSLDDFATTLSVIAKDDEAACAIVAEWKDRRPSKKQRSASDETVRDLPQWTCVTVTDAHGSQMMENVRQAGGQMYSLQYPAGAWLRQKGGVSPTDWKPVLKFIQKCAGDGYSDEMKVGEYTVKVTVPSLQI